MKAKYTGDLWISYDGTWILFRCQKTKRTEEKDENLIELRSGLEIYLDTNESKMHIEGGRTVSQLTCLSYKIIESSQYHVVCEVLQIKLINIGG